MAKPIVHDPDLLVFEWRLDAEASIVDAGANAGRSIRSLKAVRPRCREALDRARRS